MDFSSNKICVNEMIQANDDETFREQNSASRSFGLFFIKIFPDSLVSFQKLQSHL